MEGQDEIQGSLRLGIREIRGVPAVVQEDRMELCRQLGHYLRGGACADLLGANTCIVDNKQHSGLLTILIYIKNMNTDWLNKIFNKQKNAPARPEAKTEDEEKEESLSPSRSVNVPDLTEPLNLSHKLRIIGIGADCWRIVENVEESCADGADYVVIGAGFDLFESKIENKILLNSLSACGTTMKYQYPELMDGKTLVDEFSDRLSPLFETFPKQIVMLCNLGDSLCYCLYHLMRNYGKFLIPTTLIVIKPFKFQKDSYKRAEGMLSMIEKTKGYANLIIIDANDIPNMPLHQAYDTLTQTVIQKSMEMTKSLLMEKNQFTSIKALKQEEYGQVQTLCDIIKVLNDQNHFKSPQEVFDGLKPIMVRYMKRGTIGEMTRRHINGGLLNDKTLFRDGQLDCDALREKLLKAITDENSDEIEIVMAMRDTFKFVDLLLYINDFRRYTSVEQIREDFCKYIFDGLSSCGDFSQSRLNDRMFYNIPAGGHAYPFFAFLWALESLWKYISDEHGVLDNAKLQRKMIDEYQKDKANLGVEEVVKTHYSEDYCHPEVFWPDTKSYYGPVLVRVKDDRQYIESCGEGKGPNKVGDLYEFALIESMLKDDPKYVSYKQGYIPKDDFTLPVFSFEYVYGYKMHFKTEEDKIEYIKKGLSEIAKGNGNGNE